MIWQEQSLVKWQSAVRDTTMDLRNDLADMRAKSYREA